MTENEIGVLDQNKFSYRDMELEERELYLKIIKNCEALASVNEFVKMQFVKEDGIVKIDGLAVNGYIGNKDHICIAADIYKEKESIIVDMLVTILNKHQERKEFRTADEFVVENETLVRIGKANNKTVINNEDALEIIEFINTGKKKGK